MKFKILYGILFTLVFFDSKAQEKWSLEKCLNYTLKHHPEIQTVESELILDDAVIEQRKMEFLPSVSFNALEGFNLGNTYNVSTGVGQRESSFTGVSLNAGIDLFNGLAKHYSLKSSQLEKQGRLAEIKQIRFHLRRQVIEQFLAAALDNAVLQQLKEEKKTFDTLENITRKLVNKQLKPVTDLYQIQTEKQNIEIQIIQAEKNYQNNLSKLTALMNYQGKIELDFGIKPDILPIAESKKFHAEKTPEIAGLKKEAEAQKFRLKAARSGLYPKLSLQYSFHSNYYHILGEPDLIFNQTTGQYEPYGFREQLKSNRLHYIGLSLNVPIFENYRKRLQIKQEQVKLMNLEAQLEYKTNEVNKLYEQMTNDLKASFEKLQVLKSNVELAQKQVAIADKKWKHALINIFDYLQMKRQLLKNQLLYRQEQFSFQYKQLILKELIKSTGE